MRTKHEVTVTLLVFSMTLHVHVCRHLLAESAVDNEEPGQQTMSLTAVSAPGDKTDKKNTGSEATNSNTFSDTISRPSEDSSNSNEADLTAANRSAGTSYTAMNANNTSEVNISRILAPLHSNYSIKSPDSNQSHVSRDQTTLYFHRERPKELPIAIIIAGPAAAVSIFLFLCIAFYFHNLQLNNKVKRLSMTIYVTPDQSTESSKCDSCSSGTIRPAQKLVPVPAPSPSPGPATRAASREPDIIAPPIVAANPRRKSIMPTMNSSLSVPNNILAKRGSNWSTIADQEILFLSAPRRHSTFIL